MPCEVVHRFVSYELSVGLSLLAVVIFAGTMQLSGIVESQANGWWIFKGHIPAFISFVIFLIASTAEINRGPFDLAEAESELTAGFHTEYSGIKFAFFFLAEYMNMFIVSSLRGYCISWRMDAIPCRKLGRI